MDNALAMSVWPHDIAGWLQIILYVTGIISVIFSVYQYWKNSKQERMKWLYDLYQRFYDCKDYQEMFTLIENKKTEFIDHDDEKLLQSLDRYLNFFEFVSILYKKNELKLDEINDMFAYPLQRIAGSDTILKYVGKYGYEQLDALLKKLGYTS